MGRYCFVDGCKSTKYKGQGNEGAENVSFHGFPNDPSLREKWIEAVRVGNNQESASNLPKYSRICIKHFSDSCIEQFGLASRRLRPHSIPSIFPHGSIESDESKLKAVTPLETERSPENKNFTSLPPESNNEIQDKPKTPEAGNEGTEQDALYETPTKRSLLRGQIRYPGDITNKRLNNMTPKTMMKSIRLLKAACAQKNTLIKRLRTQQSRQKKKIISLSQLLTDLKKDCLISSDATNVLELASEDEDIIKHIEKGKVKGQYPPKLRAFALTLHFYSPKAYSYVRQIYQNKLPHPSTLRSWYSSVDASPGLTQVAVDLLKNRCANAGDKTLYACLMMDEMSIRQQVEWNHAEKRFIGYIDFGTSIDDPENLPVAKESLVYLLTGMNERWKIPVAYFFTAGINAEERAEITKKVLEFVDSSGIRVIGLTFDGCPANVSMCSYLLADVFNDKPYFTHPVHEDRIVRLFLDAAHMDKVIRNVWAGKGVLYDGENHPVKWEFIVSLIDLQEKDYFHLANKLNRKHKDWKKNKMNVKLAVQTFSESVANALEQLLHDDHPTFAGCSATVHFIRMMNHTFDLLNSRSLFSCGFKKPINQATAPELFDFINKAISYFASMKLQINGKPIVQTKAKTGFLGFMVDLQNLKGLYTDFVETGYMKYILSYKLSQDHLEIFFSCIRSMGGYNNNPNCMQFIAAYKRLLLHNDVKSSAEGNCIPLDDTNILTVSSRRKSDNGVIPEEVEDVHVDDVPVQYISFVANHAVEYVAGFVEMKLLKILQCETCITLLNDCDAVNSAFIKRKTMGFLRFPRTDTYKIVSIVEKIINSYRFDKTLNQKNTYARIVMNTFRHLDLSTIFKNFDAHINDLEVMENHKYFLIKLIIEIYVKVKLSHYGKTFSRQEHDSFIRRDLTKLIIFKGQ